MAFSSPAPSTSSSTDMENTSSSPSLTAGISSSVMLIISPVALPQINNLSTSSSLVQGSRFPLPFTWSSPSPASRLSVQSIPPVAPPPLHLHPTVRLPLLRPHPHPPIHLIVCLPVTRLMRPVAHPPFCHVQIFIPCKHVLNMVFSNQKQFLILIQSLLCLILLVFLKKNKI
ncbi:unnamed protein product [Cuscuta europaea]|uniref:Uncharacterized protein n=1 Tax=Cuscuta europaea TaxID=41803 RepID=A0A9P1EI79_CUSEU|nr:unnamed protein product [Cuscuta europaea]